MVSLFLRVFLAAALYFSLAGQPALAEGPRIIPVPPGVTPQWTRVPGASKLYYAPNIPTDLFRYKGSYYFFWNSMWYKGATVRGPWTPTFQVPPSLRTLDPSYLKTARPGAGPAESMTPGPGAAPGPGGAPGAAAGRPLPPGAKLWVPPGREGATATPGMPGAEAQPPGAMPQWTPPPPEVSQPGEEPAVPALIVGPQPVNNRLIINGSSAACITFFIRYLPKKFLFLSQNIQLTNNTHNSLMPANQSDLPIKKKLLSALIHPIFHRILLGLFFRRQSSFEFLQRNYILLFPELDLIEDPHEHQKHADKYW